MTRQQEFRKQTEEAKFEAFSLMCKKVADLEKENAELKKRVDNLYNSDCWASEQLTKAKEHIKRLIEAIHIWDCDNLAKTEIEAEQFLKENKNE